MNREIIELMGLAPRELKQIERRIDAGERVDRSTLLATAIVLWLLENKFRQRKDEWWRVAEKSAAWFRQETGRTGAAIDGTGLAEWVADYLRQRRINI